MSDDAAPPRRVFGDPATLHDVPEPAERACSLPDHSEQGGRTTIICDVLAITHPGLRTIDALARLQLESRRRGRQIVLRDASPELAGLLELTGLSSVLPCLEAVDSVVEVGRQSEKREEPRRVEEEGDPTEPVP